MRYPSRVPYDYETRRKYIDTAFPEEEYKERIKKTKALMEEHGLSGLIVYSSPANNDMVGHLTYLTGFWTLWGDAVFLLPLDGDPSLIYDAVTHGEPMHSCIWTTWIKDVRPSTKAEIPSNIQSWVKESKLEKRRIGLLGEQMLRFESWNRTRRLLPHVEWQPDVTGNEKGSTDDKLMGRLPPSKIAESFNDMQKIKSEREMKLIRKVCEMTDEGMRAAIEAVKPGVTEGEVMARLVAEFFEQGAHDLSFTPVIASGPRGGIKHSYPTKKKIQNGDLVYIDGGARYYGYNTDMSRVAVLGSPNRKQKEILGYVRDAYYTLLDAMKPGEPVTQIASLAQELADKSGIYKKYAKEGSYVGFAVSHGMSTGFAEWSLLDGSTIISPNLSPLAFEPMIVMLDFGTAVIESMVAFTEKGAEVLTPLKLDWM